MCTNTWMRVLAQGKAVTGCETMWFLAARTNEMLWRPIGGNEKDTKGVKETRLQNGGISPKSLQPKETDFILWPIKWADDIHIERCVAHLIGVFLSNVTTVKIARRLTDTEEDGVKQKSPSVRFSSNHLRFVSFCTPVIMERIKIKE